MKKLLWSVGALSLASGAAAKDLPSFDFKGIQATDTYAQHQGAFRKCDKYFNFNGCKFDDQEVAGVLSFPEAGWADDGSLQLIRGNFSSYNYDKIEAGFKAKWGEPDIYAVDTIQNGFGATLNIPYSVWKFAEGEMRLTGPDFRREGSFEFLSHARMAYLEGLERPKADF